MQLVLSIQICSTVRHAYGQALAESSPQGAHATGDPSSRSLMTQHFTVCRIRKISNSSQNVKI